MDLEKFYDKCWADKGEYIDYSRLDMIVKNMEKGKKVLEINWGRGLLAEKIMRKGANVTVTDLSEIAIQKARSRGINRVFKADLDTQELPFKVHLGIESGNQGFLNKVKKGIILDQVRCAVKYCKDAGIRTKGYFMIGMPEDTLETMQDTLNFAKELKLDDAMFSITTHFSNTEFGGNIDKSKIISLSNAFYFDCTNNSKNINICYNLSDAMDSDINEMMEKTQKVLEEINTGRFCKEIFGVELGFLAWQLSRIPVLKKAGRGIISLSKGQK